MTRYSIREEPILWAGLSLIPLLLVGAPVPLIAVGVAGVFAAVVVLSRWRDARLASRGIWTTAEVTDVADTYIGRSLRPFMVKFRYSAAGVARNGAIRGRSRAPDRPGVAAGDTFDVVFDPRDPGLYGWDRDRVPWA